jgi:hypothetical protein
VHSDNYSVDRLANPILEGPQKQAAQNKFFSIATDTLFEQLVSEAPPEWDWLSGQPNNYLSAQYCGRFTPNGQLDDYDCFSNYPFVCEGTYPRSRSGASHAIVDAESAAIIREQQEFENQQIRFNDFLDKAIREAFDKSRRHARKLTRIKESTLPKIEFSDRELCAESLYAEDKYENEFYYWHLSRNISEHDNVCEIFRDFHDGIIHYIHEFGCTGDIKAIDRKFTKLLPFFCPDLVVLQKPFGINF